MEGQDIARKLADTPAGKFTACQRGVIQEWQKEHPFPSNVDAVLAWNQEHGQHFRAYMNNHADLLESDNYSKLLHDFLEEESTMH